MIKRLNNKRALTFIELMVVVVLLGMSAAFAIPNFQKSVEHARRIDATGNLLSIHAANIAYFTKNDQYWPQTNGNAIAAINTNLGLNIVPNGMTYSCNGNGNNFSCTAVRAGSIAYTLTINQNAISGANPTCAGSCP